MHTLITGGSGFIGRALCTSLVADRQRVTVLTRNIDRARSRLPADVTLIDRLDRARDVDTVINLAGENLAAGRWTEARKRAFFESRIGTTQRVNAWIGSLSRRPSVLISGSAIGRYGPRGDEQLDENSAAGNDFSARLCAAWEAEALKAEALDVRVCCLRTGIVLGADGGALAKMLLPFRLGLGGPMGDGRQWMSWIARDDLVALIRWLMETSTAHGAFNGTSPRPVTNAEFAQALGRALHRPALLRTPAFALRLLFGEMADLLVRGQRVLPRRAIAQGFAFQYPGLTSALSALIPRAR
ncbi:MAG: TIGR01777 family oxidoreductase [Dokdonella sp.]